MFIVYDYDDESENDNVHKKILFNFNIKWLGT